MYYYSMLQRCLSIAIVSILLSTIGLFDSAASCICALTRVQKNKRPVECNYK